MKVIGDQWNDYVKNILPKNSSFTQVDETRKAFYAGAGVVFFGILNQASETANVDEVTDEDMALMDSIQAELDAFLKEITIEASTQ